MPKKIGRNREEAETLSLTRKLPEYLTVQELHEKQQLPVDFLCSILHIARQSSKLEDFNNRFPVDMQKAILQMAIQGKLVEQRPEEGTGEQLYQQIQAEKQKLIKAGTNKKEKPLPEITEDEIPFNIPENWAWTKLGDISWFFDAGKSPNCERKNVSGNE